jgi:hypothetical protein
MSVPPAVAGGPNARPSQLEGLIHPLPQVVLTAISLRNLWMSPLNLLYLRIMTR